MSSLLKKTWLIFYILAFGGLLTLIISTYLKHNELENNLKNEQRYATQLFNSHISSAFFQFEIMLDLISYEYSFQKSLQIDVIDNILARGPLLVGFSLFTPDGSLQFSSSSLQSAHFSNLLTSKKKNSWFQQTLTHNNMAIGRPYYLKEIKKWIIPIRKRITNPQGKVIGVIVSGLDIQALSMQWNDGTDGQRILQATIDNGLYRIIRANVALNKYEQIYKFPVPEEHIKQIEKQLALQNLSIDKLRLSGETAQLQIQIEEKNLYN